MDEWSQIQAINGPPPKSWDDYRKGCLGTYRGGHHEPAEARAFCHGMNTVFNLLEAEFPPAEQCKAAPELLDACKGLLAAHRGGRSKVVGKHPVTGHSLNQMGMACVTADAAVAKAEGES